MALWGLWSCNARRGPSAAHGDKHFDARSCEGDARGRVTVLILDQLRRAQPLASALPWPRDGALTSLCQALYADPANLRGPDEWGRELGMSGRTLARRFEVELGMSLRSWRRRLRVFKAIELLGGGLGVTQTAMELGYGSTSAFILAFRSDTR
jgi:AraC-like DNA-binding protein